MPRSSFVIPATALGIVALAAVFLVYAPAAEKPTPEATQTAAVTGAETMGASAASSPLLPATTTVKNQTTKGTTKTSSKKEVIPIHRIENPYPTAPESFDTVNDLTRGALVNILCTPESGSLRPISGSGVIIDPRGVILTNAHVAQYVLLSQSPQVNLSCVTRTGSPARDAWNTEVLFIPPLWVEQHAADLTATAPTGTGEHDYALLRITGPVEGNATQTLPSLRFDAREAIAFLGDGVLVGAYPAEFVGSSAAQNQLYPATSLSTIKDLLTFKTTSVDLLSVGGVVEAQSGSSGGAVVNAWGRLVGLITTTSEGATTADRDLRALTMSYIDRDIHAQSGSDLASILNGDIAAEAAAFRTVAGPRLTQMLIDQLSKSR